MISYDQMGKILEEPDRKVRESMIMELSGEDARKMLISLTRLMRRGHDEWWEAEHEKK